MDHKYDEEYFFATKNEHDYRCASRLTNDTNLMVAYKKCADAMLDLKSALSLAMDGKPGIPVKKEDQ